MDAELDPQNALFDPNTPGPDPRTPEERERDLQEAQQRQQIAHQVIDQHQQAATNEMEARQLDRLAADSAAREAAVEAAHNETNSSG